MRLPASSMWMMRATWALVLVLPWPVYVIEIGIGQRYLDEAGLVGGRTVECFGVGVGLAVQMVVALCAAWIGPRIVHRRAIDRLRRRARFELDPLRDGTYRARPLVQRFPDEEAALKSAYARYAARSAGTLAVIASLELTLFFAMTITRSFACFGGGGTTVFVPSAGEYLPLLGVLVVVTALEFPRRGAALRWIRDLLGARPSSSGNPSTTAHKPVPLTARCAPSADRQGAGRTQV